MYFYQTVVSVWPVSISLVENHYVYDVLESLYRHPCDRAPGEVGIYIIEGSTDLNSQVQVVATEGGRLSKTKRYSIVTRLVEACLGRVEMCIGVTVGFDAPQ